MAQLKLRPGAPAAFPDPDVIPLPASDPDVISLAGQEDPDVIPLGNAGVGQPARPATTPLTSSAQPAHNEAAGVSQPQGQGPIPPLAYPHTPTKVGAGISRRPAPTAQQPAFSPNQTIEILPRLESVSPIPAPPMPAAPIPTGLQGRPSRTPQGEFPRFGPGQDLAIPGPLPAFQGVIPGIEKMGRGFSRMSYGTPAAGLGGSPRQTTSQAPNQIDPDAWRPPDLPARVGAAADLVEGFEEASAPYVMPALAAGAVAGGIPAATMIGANMLFGAAGEELTRRGLESAGVDPRYAKAAGKVVGWGPVEKTPGYSHAIGGAAEALIPDSPTKQFATGLGKSVEEFNTLVDDLAKMDPASPEYSQSLSQLKAGEAQLGVAANTLAQANLLGAIKSAQVMGKMRKVPAAETAATAAQEPLPSPDIISLPAADSVSAGEPKYKSGTTQYNLPDGIGAKVQYIGEQIPDSALAESGRESQPHLTIRYGLGEDPQTSLPKIKSALADQAPITVKLGEASLFPDRGDGEVLKLDLEKSPELEAIREKITQAGIDHIPDIGDAEGYSPHITVAYLKPGEGQKYVGPNPLTGQELVIDRLWLGDRQGNQYEVPFGKSLEGILGPENTAARPLLEDAQPGQAPAAPKFSIETRQLGPEYLKSRLVDIIRTKLPERARPKDILAALNNAGLSKEERAFQQDFFESLERMAEYTPDRLLDRADLEALPRTAAFREVVKTGRDTQYEQFAHKGPDTIPGTYRERLFVQPWTRGAPRSHWPDHPGTMLHVRETDQYVGDGTDNKVLLVDEIQSDWAQQGRSRGYLQPGQTAKDFYAKAESAARSAAIDAMLQRLPENTHEAFRADIAKAAESEPLTPGRYTGIRQTLLDYFNDHLYETMDVLDIPGVDAYVNRHYTNDLPIEPTPYPDSWAELAIRRTLQIAAQDPSYVKFRWLSGEYQAERFSVGGIVDTIGYDPKTGRLIGSRWGDDVIDRKVPQKDLPGVVGKAVADKLLTTELREFRPGSGERWHVLEGEQLEVGGKFHKTLYDVRIPSYVKKLTKQQPRQVPLRDKYGRTLGMAWEIDITPEVRAKMSEPQPLFHVTQAGQASPAQLWTPEQLAKSLPGYKLELLPNNEKTNPGGATLGIETPSGKWAKIIVTRGKDLPASPDAMATQLGRPALPGEIVVGQYESRGLREQSVITLAGAAGPETLDHELFHYAFDTFLTPKEQAAILAAHGSEEAAAIAYGQGKGGLDPGLSRLKKLFTEIHNKFYPDSKATIERLRQGQIWERQARYGVDTREPVYRKPDGSLDWSLDSMAKSFLETFDRNLVRFESNDPVFLAATLAAPGTSQSISREALIGPAQEIARAMHAGGYGQGSLQQGWRAFAEVLIDNRLAGVQGRWNDLAGAVEKATQKQLRQGLARHGDAPDGPLIRVLDRIDSDQPMANGNSRAGKVQAMLEAKDYAGAKAYLGALFRHNAYATKRLDLQGTYGKDLSQFAQDPQFKSALQIYKSKVEALFASHHLKNEGMLSADLGPLDTYYPLVPQETGDMPIWQQSARQRGYWIRPHNPSNYFTTGLATKGYDPELSTLRGRLTAAIRGGNVAQFLQVMRGTGLAVKVTDANAATAIFRGGEELPVTVLPLGSAQSISVKGQQLKVPPQYIAVPKALGPTCKSIVLGEGPGGSSAFHSEGFIEDAVNRITGWSLVGPADAAFHAQAVLSSLVAGTPYLRQSNVFLSVMANLPVTKAFTAMWEAYRKPAKWFTSPEGEKTLMAMAQGGMLNPRIGSVAWDKDYAELFGAEWKPPVWRTEAWRRTPEESAEAKAGGLGAKIASYLDVAGRIGDLGTSAVVFGHPGEGSSRWLGLDLRARVALYELHLQLFPDAPLADRANFVNQAMQYNWGLQSHLEQYIKGYAGTRFTSVFFTAGYSMIRAGVRAMNPVGTRHGLNRLDPIGQQQLARAQRAFSGGVTGMVAGWALLNFASSGGKHWPWETDQEGGPVPLNSIALPDDIRQSPVGLALMGDPAKGAPKRGYMPMGFFNAAVKKGLDVTGARAAYDTGKLLEGKPGQVSMGWTDPVGRQLIAMEAMRSSMNTFLHPLTSGPIPRAGMAALGMSPWIGPMWDPITGRNQFSLRSESRAAGSLFEATGAGLARAAGQMSPMANFLNEAGMESVLGSPLSGATKRDDGAAWAKTLADIMFPRSRPVGKDIPKMVERTRELVTKRKDLIKSQRADAARATRE